MLSQMNVSVYASSERFIAERHTVKITSPKSGLQKSWQSAIDYCGTIRCEVLSSRIYSASATVPPSGEVTFRVVPGDFNKLISRLGELGTVVEHSTDRQDETNSVINTDAQLKNLTSFRDSLRSMLSKSPKVSDLVEIQKQLSETQAQIDSADMQRKVLANEVEKIAVEVSFRSESTPGESSRGEISRAFHQAGTVLADSIANLITTIVFLLPWTILIVPATWFSVRLLRRRKFLAVSKEPTLRSEP